MRVRLLIHLHKHLVAVVLPIDGPPVKGVIEALPLTAGVAIVVGLGQVEVLNILHLSLY